MSALAALTHPSIARYCTPVEHEWVWGDSLHDDRACQAYSHFCRPCCKLCVLGRQRLGEHVGTLPDKQGPKSFGASQPPGHGALARATVCRHPMAMRVISCRRARSCVWHVACARAISYQTRQ